MKETRLDFKEGDEIQVSTSAKSEDVYGIESLYCPTGFFAGQTRRDLILAEEDVSANSWDLVKIPKRIIKSITLTYEEKGEITINGNALSSLYIKEARENYRGRTVI